MAMDYAKESKQEIVIIQRDVEKYYDHVSWSSVAQIMFHMGFGARMSHPTFMFGVICCDVN